MKEVWKCTASSGTEVYHPYYNLGNSEITNLTVSEDNQKYTTLSSWNTSASFNSKAYKCGINTLSNGVELCWGISSYSSHTYTVNYTITNFVSELTDSQMIYWTLIPYEFSNTISQVYIKIHSDFDYDFETPVWGYGNYGGTCYVYDGYIEMASQDALASDEYMTILAKFPSGTFSTSNKLNKNFNFYYEMSQEGATKYQNNSTGSSFPSIIYIFMIFATIITIMFNSKNKLSNKSLLNTNFGETGNKIPKDVPMFRDIPCNGDVFRAYWIAFNYGLLKKKTNLLGALLLKWLKENKISIQKETVGVLFKKEDTCVVFNKSLTLDNQLENEIYQMMLSASKDGILESKEFEKWCSINYSKFFNWFDKVLDYERDLLVAESKITTQEEVSLKIFKSTKYLVDSSMMEEAKQLKGLKTFFDEFTMIDKREAIEVALFEDYLIFAQILDVADKVAKQFKKLYPEIIENSNYTYDYTDILFINTFAISSIKSADKARANAYSSGGRRLFFWWRPEVAHLVVGGGRRWLPLKYSK